MPVKSIQLEEAHQQRDKISQLLPHVSIHHAKEIANRWNLGKPCLPFRIINMLSDYAHNLAIICFNQPFNSNCNIGKASLFLVKSALGQNVI